MKASITWRSSRTANRARKNRDRFRRLRTFAGTLALFLVIAAWERRQA